MRGNFWSEDEDEKTISKGDKAMTRQKVTVLLAVTFLFLLFPAVVLAEDYTWSDNGDGTCTITDYTGLGGDVTIPDTLAGLTVTSIGNAAFQNCDALTYVSIPDSVTSIGNDAFNRCRSLTSVTIPDSVTFIGNYVLAFCDALISVTVGSSVTSIGSYAFYSCDALTGVYFKGNAPSLGSSVFSGVSATVYYIPWTAGWGATFGGLPTAEWPPSPADVDLNYEVDMYDFSMLAGQWGQAGCQESNDWCNWADFDQSGSVDPNDLTMLANDWLFGIVP